jgi:hypothetical protein
MRCATAALIVIATAMITPATFLEVGRLMIANLGGPMSVLMPAADLSAVVSLRQHAVEE